MRKLLPILSALILALPTLALACGNEFNEADGTFLSRNDFGVPYWLVLAAGTPVIMLMLTAPYWLYFCQVRKDVAPRTGLARYAKILDTVVCLFFSVFLSLLSAFAIFIYFQSQIFSDYNPEGRAFVWGLALIALGISAFHLTRRRSGQIPQSRLRRISLWWKDFVIAPSAIGYLGIFALFLLLNSVGALH